MQPPEGLYNYNYASETNDPLKATFLGKSFYGRKYLFPAEYDVFVDVSPYKYRADS
jgi:hypothetical protein